MYNLNTFNQLNNFINNYKGNPKEDAMRMIERSGMDQAQLNKFQNQANQLYAMAKNMGIVK